MQLNLKHVARLVAIALGIAFTALTIFYCIGIMPDFTHNLNGLLHDGYAYEYASNYIFYIVGQFIVPILLLVAAVLATLQGIFAKKTRLLPVSVLIFAISCLALSAYWLNDLLPDMNDIPPAIFMTVYLVTAVFYLPIILETFRRRPSLASKILGSLGFALYLAATLVFTEEIKAGYARVYFSGVALESFHLLTPMVPFIVALVLTTQEKATESVLNNEAQDSAQSSEAQESEQAEV